MNQEVNQIEMYRAICWQSCQSAKGAQTKAKVFLEVKSVLTGGGRGGVAMSDTHVFLLNEYFIDLNTANFNILNKFLN